MAITISSTTSSQADLDHAVSDNWREPLAEKPAPEKIEEVVENPEISEETKPAVSEEIETAAESEAAKPKPKPKSGFLRRIDKLTAQNYALQNKVAEYEAKLKPAEQSAQPKSNEPKLADFGNDIEKWTAARDQWKEAETTRQAEQESQKATFDAYNRKVSEARGEYDDWDEAVTGSSIVIPQAAYLAVVESENGPDVAYYLATHQDETAQLMEMSSIGAVKAIAKISDKLIEAKASPPVKAEKPKPPAPLNPVGASSTRSNVPLDQLSMKDYMKIRNKQERENKRL